MSCSAAAPPAGRLVLVHSADPAALFAHAAEPFCRPGRLTERPPLLAVRQGGIRDELQERAARAGCAGWLGAPVVVFGELPALVAGDLAPLTALERRAVIRDLLGRTPLRRLGGPRPGRGLVDALDRLFGDLAAECVSPDALGGGSAGWEAERDADLGALYAAYLAAVAGLPARDGVPRSDGRDGRTIAAARLRDDPAAVRRRLRRPLGDPDEPVTVAIYGLNDLRRGWDRLLDALLGAPFVDEVRVYLLLDAVDGEAARRDRAVREAIGEYELADALLARAPRAVVRVPDAAVPAATAGLRDALFGPGLTAPYVEGGPVAAAAAPDMARELEHVAREVKRLIVDGGVPPHRIAVVSRKSRPYGPRAAELLRRHGVPVSARLRWSLAEVPAVAALVRVFRLGAEGFTWRALAELSESSYFDLDLDAGLLRRAGTSRRLRTLDDWDAALAALAGEASFEAMRGGDPDERRGVDAARTARAAAAFAAFRGDVEPLGASAPRGEWIGRALACLGRDAGGGRGVAAREGLWGLCRNACRAPHDEHDALLVDATRRDVEALDVVGGLLAEWRASLALLPGAAEAVLSPAEWYAELTEALGDGEVVLNTPHRRGVLVLEASAAVWRTFDHLFLAGMSAGEFPAEPAGRELFGEHEREARYAAGLPIEPARVWFAREASLLRTLVGGARASVRLSHAYADADGAAQIPSAYFDEVVSRFTGGGAARDDAWVEQVPGSRVAPAGLGDAWCAADLHLLAAAGRDADAERRADADAALAHLAGDAGHAALVERVLASAGTEHARRALRADPPARRGDSARAWNGAVTSGHLLAALGERHGDGAVWSASGLEAYGRCGFTFFGRYVMGLRADEEPEEEMDRAARGSLVHACLARLHEQLAHDLGDDALTGPALRRAEHLLPRVVRRALDEHEKTGRGGHPALRACTERELTERVRANLVWEVGQAEGGQTAYAPPRRRPLFTEYAFGVDGRPAVTLHLNGRTLRLRGTIDRVDEITTGGARGWRYVVDHKTSKASLDPVALYEAGAILQLPLYVHALDATADRGGGVWGGAYQLVKDGGSRTAALHPHAVTAAGRPTKGALEARDRLDGALEHAFLHVDGIRRGEFPARIPDCSASKGCPPYCALRDACREDRPARGGAR